MLSDGPADPRAVRTGYRRSLPAPQPDLGRKAGDHRRRRLWAGRVGALFGHRPAVSTALQADSSYGTGRRVSALPVVGPWPEDRTGDALGRGMSAPGQIRFDHPHRVARGALFVWRAGALQRSQEAF